MYHPSFPPQTQPLISILQYARNAPARKQSLSPFAAVEGRGSDRTSLDLDTCLPQRNATKVQRNAMQMHTGFCRPVRYPSNAKVVN